MAESRLLSLPTEIRLQIWDHLLAPNNTTIPGTIDSRAVTAISRPCSATTYSGYRGEQAYAHELDDTQCDCNGRQFYIYTPNGPLSTAILRVNKHVYAEALSSLYERRVWTADPNRVLASLYDRYAEVWFLFERFLRTIPEDARSHIRCIRLPMLLSRFEVNGARKAFYSIAQLLPRLQMIEIQFSAAVVRAHWFENDLLQEATYGLFDLENERETYFLGPVMAFADAKIIVTAVDKQDLDPLVFARLKPCIEMRVWRQLLPVRVKREQRRIGRIKSALRSLDHADVSAESC